MSLLRPPRRLRVTPEGKWFIALTLAAGGAAINTGNNLLYVVFGTNLALVVVSGILSELSLRGIRVEIRLASEAFANRDTLLAVAADAGRKRFPAIALTLSAEVDGERHAIPLPFVARGASASRTLAFRPRRRGTLAFGACSVSTRFPFALFEKSTDIPPPGPGVVYPEPAGSLPDVAAGRGKGCEAGTPSPGRGTGTGVRGVRDHEAGDPFRDIHWKASARLGRWMVREREREERDPAEIRLPADARPETFERLVSGACAAVLACEREGRPYRIRQGDRLRVDATAHPARREALGYLATAEPAPPAAPPGSREGSRPPAPAGGEDPLLAPSLPPAAWWILRLYWATGLLAVALLTTIHRPLLAAAAAALVAGAFLDRARPRRPGRPAAEAAGALAVAAGAGADLFLGSRDPLSAAAILLLGVQSIRLLAPKGRRDCWQLLAIAFLEFLAAAASSSEFRFAFLALPFPGLSAGAMWAMQAWERAEADPRDGGRLPLPFAVRLLAAVALSAALLTAFFFAVTPRLRLDALHRSPAGSRPEGFPDSIAMTGMSALRDSRRVVARVEFLSLPRGASPPGMYLRGEVFTRFDGERWTRPDAAVHRIRRAGWIYDIAPVPASGVPTGEAEITLQPSRDPFLFAYGSPFAIEGFVGDLRHDGRGNLWMFAPGHPLMRYRVRFALPPAPFSLHEPPPAEEDLRVPDGWEDLRGVALSAAPGDLPERERAARLLGHLRTGYRYTRSDPAASLREFLSVRKAGYCEHFAAACCLLLRASGIPARVAAGYLGGEWNGLGGYLVVRGTDAHAWTEAWIGGRWETLDATPPAETAEAAARGMGRAAAWADWMRFRWDKYVVNYDMETQARGVAEGLEAFGRLEARARRLARSGHAFGRTGLLALAAILALLAATTFLFGRRRRTAQAAGGAPPRPYARLLRRLERAGYRTCPGMPMGESLRRAAAERPSLAADAEPFLALYLRDRFGAEPLPPEGTREAFSLAERLSRALSRPGAR